MIRFRVWHSSVGVLMSFELFAFDYQQAIHKFIKVFTDKSLIPPEVLRVEECRDTLWVEVWSKI